MQGGFSRGLARCAWQRWAVKFEEPASSAERASQPFPIATRKRCMCVMILPYTTLCTTIEHIHTYTYMHTSVHTYIHAYTHTHTHTYIHTYIHAYIHTHIPTYIHTNIHTCILHTFIRMIRIYIHTVIHTYIYTCTAYGPSCVLLLL